MSKIQCFTNLINTILLYLHDKALQVELFNLKANKNSTMDATHLQNLGWECKNLEKVNGQSTDVWSKIHLKENISNQQHEK